MKGEVCVVLEGDDVNNTIRVEVAITAMAQTET